MKITNTIKNKKTVHVKIKSANIVTFNKLDNAQRALLHWHNKLDHIGFNQLKDLASRRFVPKIIARAGKVKCPAYYQ